MSKRARARKQQDWKIQLFIGGGLILLGIAVFMLLSPRSDAGSATVPDDLSVVPAAVQYSAPQLSLQDLDGGTESLADYRDDVVLVNNWATWCPPCKAEMPTLEAYYEAHATDGLMIIAIEAGEAGNEVEPFVQNFRLTFRVWLDPNNASLWAFGNQSLPNSYVIDRTGTVRYAWTGAISRSMLEEYVTPLLAPGFLHPLPSSMDSIRCRGGSGSIRCGPGLSVRSNCAARCAKCRLAA